MILVDELLDYVRQLSFAEHSDLSNQDMAFMRALTDTVNDVPRVAMVVVMIRSEQDSIMLDAEGTARRGEIEDLLTRNGKTATVTSNTDFAEISAAPVRGPGAGEVVAATSDLYARRCGASGQPRFANRPRPPRRLRRRRAPATVPPS